MIHVVRESARHLVVPPGRQRRRAAVHQLDHHVRRELRERARRHGRRPVADDLDRLLRTEGIHLFRDAAVEYPELLPPIVRGGAGEGTALFAPAPGRAVVLPEFHDVGAIVHLGHDEVHEELLDLRIRDAQRVDAVGLHARVSVQGEVFGVAFRVLGERNGGRVQMPAVRPPRPKPVDSAGQIVHHLQLARNAGDLALAPQPIKAFSHGDGLLLRDVPPDTPRSKEGHPHLVFHETDNGATAGEQTIQPPLGLSAGIRETSPVMSEEIDAAALLRHDVVEVLKRPVLRQEPLPLGKRFAYVDALRIQRGVFRGDDGQPHTR